MKEKINVFDYSELINKQLKKPGFFLNTNNEKFNSMIIAWGHLGILWSIDTFVVYVRQSRYTKAQIDKTQEFTLSIPLNNDIDPEVYKACGSMSGRDIDKAKYFTLVEPSVNNTPGIKEYPLTIECKVIYSEDQVLDKIPQDIKDHHYNDNDYHTMYVGKIVDAYIIKD